VPWEFIAQLSSVVTLDFRNNRLSGDLPANMGTKRCLPNLNKLDVQNNKGIGGELCDELMQKAGVSLSFFSSGEGCRIRTSFFVGVSLPSEKLTSVKYHVKDLLGGVRTQPKLQPISVRDGPGDDPSQPMHRCLRLKKGSAGDAYYPWQKVWSRGLRTLGEHAKVAEKKEIVYIVCHEGIQ